MQTTTAQYDLLATGNVRPLDWRLSISFDKQINPLIKFFTLDDSLLDGVDILSPDDTSSILLWDQFQYQDYTDRVISMEVTRLENEPYSNAMAYADLTINNYDDYFTPDAGSPIELDILPRRPFRIFMGFKNNVLPQFVGMSETMPKIDRIAKTASFHLIDFLSYLYEQDISETILLENVRTDQVLDHLLDMLGILPSQYELETGINTMRVFYAEKGKKFGTICDELMEAEIGRLFMDESGIIKLQNRYSYNLTPVDTLDDTNCTNYEILNEDTIINRVRVTVPVRVRAEEQSVYRLSQPRLITIGETAEIIVNFDDPIFTVNDPVYSATPIVDSYFRSTTDEAGFTPYTGIDFVSSQVYSKFAIYTFENTGASDAYIVEMDLFGEPAKVISEVVVDDQDNTSIAKFEEQIYEIKNEYIQDRDNAVSRTTLLLFDYAEYGSIINVTYKGNFALQLGDAVSLDLGTTDGIFIIGKISNLLIGSSFTQRLTLRKKRILNFFILDQSLLDGDDRLGI